MTPTPTPNTIQNASNGLSGGFASSTDLGPVVLIVMYAVGFLLAAQYVAPWAARSELLSRVGSGLGQSVLYAIKGVAASAVMTITALPAWVVWQLDAGTRGVALEYLGYAIGGYVVLMAVGWAADTVVSTFIEAHPEYDEWSDLFPDAPDDELADAEAGD